MRAGDARTIPTRLRGLLAMRIPSAEARVEVWNTYLRGAWMEGAILVRLAEPEEAESPFTPLGGLLDEEKQRIVRLVTFLVLAIEARANHMIWELEVEGKLSAAEGEAARRLAPKHKWFLLPKLAGSSRNLTVGQGKHQVIEEICRFRNTIAHIKFGYFDDLKSLSVREAVRYYNRFLEAVMDLNEIVRGEARTLPAEAYLPEF